MDIGSPSESAPLKPRDRILRVMLDFLFSFLVCTLYLKYGADLDGVVIF